VQPAYFAAVYFAAVALNAVQTPLEVENRTRAKLEVELRKRRSFNFPELLRLPILPGDTKAIPSLGKESEARK